MAQRITFCKFIPSDKFDANKTIELLQNKNTAENYYLFNEQGTSFILGCYYSEQSFINERYNIESGEMEKITNTRQYVVKFEIDLKSQTLMLWGGKKLVPTMLTEIGMASENSVVIDEISIDFKKVISKITKINNVRIIKLKVINIPIEQGIIATCTINVDSIEYKNDFIKKYIDKITQLSVVLSCDYIDDESLPSVNATLYSTGSFVVHKDRDSISDEIIDVLKNIIF